MEKITQASQYINLMVYMIRADGLVDDEETSRLFALLEQRLEDPIGDDQVQDIVGRLSAQGSDTPSDEQLLEAGAGIDGLTLAHLVRDAYSLAASDGEIHQAEVSTMRRFLRLSGIPVVRFADIDHWARGSADNFTLGVSLLTPAP